MKRSHYETRSPRRRPAAHGGYRRTRSGVPAGFQRECAARRPAGVHPRRAVPGHDRTRGLPFPPCRGGHARGGPASRDGRLPLRLRQRQQRTHPRPRPRAPQTRHAFRARRRARVQRVRHRLPPRRARSHTRLGGAGCGRKGRARKRIGSFPSGVLRTGRARIWRAGGVSRSGKR